MKIKSNFTPKRFLAFILGRNIRPHKANLYVPKLVLVRMEKDSTACLRQQLLINIGQINRGLLTGPFERKHLNEFLDLLPAVEGWSLMSDAQQKLLEQYVLHFWKLAKESDNFEQTSAYDSLLESLYWATRKKPVFA